MNRESDVDEIILELGEFGKFQIFNYALLSFVLIFATSSYLSYVFTSAQLDYRCKIPECDINDQHSEIDYLPDWLVNAVPYDGKDLPAKCSRYQYVGSGGGDGANGNYCGQESFNKSHIMRCNEFVYDGDEVTVLNEFNMTCEENEWTLTLIGSLGYIPELVMLPLCAFMSDKYGRKPILIWTVLFSGIFGLSKSFSSSYIMYAVLEFIYGIVSSGTYITIYVMAIESSGPNQRVFSGTLISALYSVAQMSAGIVAMFFHNFRTFLRILYVPNLLILSFVWLIPESIRWLITKGKMKQARKIIFRAAKLNGIELSDSSKHALYCGNEIKIISDNEINTNTVNNSNGPQLSTSAVERNVENQTEISKDKTNLYLTAIKSKSLMLRLVLCWICWCAICFTYYGMTINSVSLAGDKYVNYILANFIEIPAILLSYFIMNKWGRKRCLFTCLLLCGVGCIVSQFVPPHLTVLQLIVYIAGKFAITLAFTIIYIFTTELFPTCLRHSFINTCSVVGTMGTILAPQTPLLIRFWEPLPVVIFGGVSFLAAFIVLLLPETRNSKLPDSIKEAELL